MQEKGFSELTQNLKQREVSTNFNYLRSNDEYRRLLPSKLYKIGEALIHIQGVFTIVAFFVGLNNWAVLLSVLVSFFGIGFLVRHRGGDHVQNEWIITKLTLLSLCLIIQLMLSAIGKGLMCI